MDRRAASHPPIVAIGSLSCPASHPQSTRRSCVRPKAITDSHTPQSRGVGPAAPTVELSRPTAGSQLYVVAALLGVG
jgi:hypothetical protein